MFRKIGLYRLPLMVGTGIVMSYASPAIGIAMLMASGGFYLLLDWKSQEWKSKVSRECI